MSKTATVTKAEYTGKTWTNQEGKVFHFHDIAFDNNDAGQYMSVKDNQDKFKVGEQAEYEVIPKDGYPDKIKPVQSAKPFGGGGGKRGSNASFALSYAKDLACANIEKGMEVKSTHVTAIADHFLKWLNDNE